MVKKRASEAVSRRVSQLLLSEIAHDHDGQSEAKFNHRHDRTYAWALKQSKADLAETVANLFPEYMLLRKLHRLGRQSEKLYMAALGHSLAEIEKYQAVAVRLASRLGVDRSNRTKGAHEKLRKDPASREKAAAKAGALELWLERRSGKRPQLRTVEQFATEVMRRWPVLKSAKVICGWSAEWTKAAKAGRTPAC